MEAILFEQEAKAHLQSYGWKAAGLAVILWQLYAYAIRKLREARNLPVGTTEWVSKIHLVALLMQYTPLNLLGFLADDPDLYVDMPGELAAAVCIPPVRVVEAAKVELEIDGIIYSTAAAWRGMMIS